MTSTRAGGLAAIGAAGTYLAGFAMLLAVLVPAGYGFNPMAAEEAVEFLVRNTGMMIAWNSVVYILNAMLLAVLVVTLHGMLAATAPRSMPIASLFGLIWVGLLLASGMVANSSIAMIATLGQTDPAQAAMAWQVLRTVENGLGGGNEIAGALWLGLGMGFGASAAAVPILVRALGCIAGVAGLMTLLPSLSEPMGAVFGLATLAWFLAIGWVLLRQRSGRVGPRAQDRVGSARQAPPCGEPRT